uniref:Uncharacterized protein n=1 Tax=Utricularia reniformis TaxID=192314 RepID=A0A1Y0B2D2_9LAMI|nr:hypothetical protein AEK19_MT1407 [Utricularia reniformis]ART31602.1 hypothetical protein AEK19_MT1407 [Utricularia reniformis]
MKAMLMWDAVESEVEPEFPRNATPNQEKVYEEKVSISCSLYFKASVDDSIFPRIMTLIKSGLFFHYLEKTFQFRLSNLRKDLETVKMHETEKLKEYIDRVTLIVNQMAEMRLMKVVL